MSSRWSADAVKQLYSQYGGELEGLTRQLRARYHRMVAQGYKVAFGDVEGEIMYMIVRERRPAIAFEISPASGWSTGYILAALDQNGAGELHSFELDREIRGRPTAAVIRENTSPWGRSRHTIHIGDARATVGQVAGDVDFLLIDSCHEAWFAEWYVASVFPRVRGPVVIQDVAFADQLEPSSEARFVWDWLGRERVPVSLIGQVEAELDAAAIRAPLAERRNSRSNAVLFELPQDGLAALPPLSTSPEALIKQARAAVRGGEVGLADARLCAAVFAIRRQPGRMNRHRLLLAAAEIYGLMGESAEQRRCLRRAFGVIVQGDRPEQEKGLPEFAPAALEAFAWRLLAQCGVALAFVPGAWLGACRSVGRWLGRVPRRLLRRLSSRRRR